LHGLRVQSSEALEGLCEGVDSQGALQILTSEGRQTINSSEVSVRPL
jgi:biotin-(acetyl-CoA carboxylase) ligase